MRPFILHSIDFAYRASEVPNIMKQLLLSRFGHMAPLPAARLVRESTAAASYYPYGTDWAEPD